MKVTQSKYSLANTSKCCLNHSRVRVIIKGINQSINEKMPWFGTKPQRIMGVLAQQLSLSCS